MTGIYASDKRKQTSKPVVFHCGQGDSGDKQVRHHGDYRNHCDVCQALYEVDVADGKNLAVLMNSGDTRPKGLCWCCPRCADVYMNAGFVPFTHLADSIV